MKNQFASRVQAINESKTARVFTLADRLRRQGKDIVSLAVGEPDFDAPAEVIRATQNALAAQATRYGPTPGIDALRARLAIEFNGYSQENILITNGAKQALFTVFQLLCQPGDEVIVPMPCWVSFTEQIKMAGGCPVPVATAGHQIDPQTIENAVTQRTKAILINTPNNPTGAVYSQAALAHIAALAEKKKIYLLSDEAYHMFTYDRRPYVKLYDTASGKDPIITIRSFSKHFNMTGFRLGYVAAHASIIRGLTKLQSHISGNVCTFAQHGALAALEMDQTVVEKRRLALEQRRDMAYHLASNLFDCIKPQGAFYLFPNVTRYLKKNDTSEALAMRLLDKAGVAVVPGEAFGSAGHIRISFGTSEAELQKAFERITKVL